MHDSVLTNHNIIKIYLCFVDGRKISRKELVTFRAIDEKNCYFYGPSVLDMVKPGWFNKADLVVYTTDGTYSATVKIREIDFSLEKILYTIANPKKWNFTQLRVSDRKSTSLPIKIEFSDEKVLESEITNLSTAGFSIYAKDNFGSLQMKLPCACQIQLPEGSLSVKAKYVRQELILDDYELAGYKSYSFKFINLFPDQKALLKNYLQNIN